MPVFPRSKRSSIPVAALAVLGLTFGLSAAPSSAGSAVPGAVDPENVVLERLPDEIPQVREIVVPDADALDRLIATGVDLDHGVEQEKDGLAVQAVVTENEMDQLGDLGFEVGDVLVGPRDSKDALAERTATVNAHKRALATLRTKAADDETSDVKIMRADYYTSFGQPVLAVEAMYADGSNTPELTVERDSGPGTEFGSGGTQQLRRFVDAGVYLYHEGAASVTTRPDRIRITSPSGDVAIVKVNDWLPTVDGEPDPFKGPGYQQDFIYSYLDPTQLYQRIKQLARTYPDLAEIVELPYQTNGYRRLAQALVGPSNNAAARFGIDSKAWGHEGGNGLSIAVTHPTEADAALSVSVDGKAITVSSATDASGAATSTAAQIVAAINANAAAGELVFAYTYRGNAGDGVVPATPATVLSDELKAPGHVSHEPQPVYAIKIGKTRDGSKPGVFYYAQEHAREWVPPLVTVETAERLLRNYATHAPTRDLVDNLEIWIMPSVNPDGGHYSFYDFASQRKNMTRHCDVASTYDAGSRNSWGVDVNRNYTEYSAFDGYSGASTTSCTSGTSAGPAELSEPEAQNVDWVASQPNMTFSMNVHSSGNYFMWSPAAYKVPGRETAPRPTLEEEEFFWGASSRILTSIKRHRGLSVTPSRTGPVVDVLYSAAGNSGDMLWYKYGIYAWDFEVGSMFQPPFEALDDPNAPSAHEESQEFANGLVEMARVALDYERDDVPPVTTVEVTDSATEGKVNVRFDTNEPAAIFYTLDGTVPSLQSTRYDAAGLRDTNGELLKVDEGTEIHWIAVDSRGNVERHFVPGTDGNYRTWIAEVGWEEPLAASDVELAVSPSTVTVGQGTTAEVTVSGTGPGDQPVPSGVVSIVSDDLVIGTAELDDTGSASVELAPFTTAGTRVLTAEYGGDGAYAQGVSSKAVVKVEKASSSVAATIAPAKVTPKKRAKVKVTVSAPGAELSGEVLVNVAGKVAGSGVINAQGKVTVTLPKYSAGKRKVVVRYLGNDHVKASRTTLTLVVKK